MKSSDASQSKAEELKYKARIEALEKQLQQAKLSSQVEGTKDSNSNWGRGRGTSLLSGTNVPGKNLFQNPSGGGNDDYAERDDGDGNEDDDEDSYHSGYEYEDGADGSGNEKELVSPWIQQRTPLNTFSQT